MTQLLGTRGTSSGGAHSSSSDGLRRERWIITARIMTVEVSVHETMTHLLIPVYQKSGSLSRPGFLGVEKRTVGAQRLVGLAS
jgi:hypothetical protein